MWRLCKLGYRHEPRLMGFAFVSALLAALPDALLALWLALLGDGVIEGDADRVRIAAIGLAVSAVATWFLRTVSTRLQRRFRDKVTIALESHVAHLQASVATIAHQERPELLDRLSVLRDQVFVLDHMYLSVFSTAGFVLRLVITIVLLAYVDPALLLLGVFAIPTVITSSWRPGVERRAEEAGAASKRLASHLFTTATTAPPAKEVRVTGIGPRLVEQRRASWETLVRAGGAHPRGVGAVAQPGVGGVRPRLRRRHRLRRVRASTRPPADVLLVRGRRLAPVRLHRRDRRRDRLPARHLDGRLAAAGLARGLRRRPRRPPPTCRSPSGSTTASGSRT